MSFFIQHGYGKGGKLQSTAIGGHLSGIVLSPADEDRDSLLATANDALGSGLQVLLDPQAFVYATTPAGSGRCHESHGLNLHDIHWSQNASASSRQVSAVETANAAIGLTGPKIAPTVLQTSFADVWTPLSIQLARTAAAEWGAENTLASVVVDEAALSDWQTVQDWLDVVTTLDVRGFYLLIDRHRRDYPPVPWEKSRLTNLLRVQYRLAVLNEYEVLWGYSDFEGLLGLAVGATAACAGWHYSLRQFNTAKWQPRPRGGQPPSARMSVPMLWAPLRAEVEAEALFDTDLRDELFTSSLIQRFDREPFSTWTRLQAQEQHMRTLAQRADQIVSIGDIRQRVDSLIESFEGAGRRYQDIARRGISLPPLYSSRVESFRGALTDFANEETL